MKKEPLEREAKADATADGAAPEHDSGEHFAHAEVQDEDEEAGENDSDSTSGSDTRSEYSDEPEVDKSNWPLLYQIMDVDPETLDRDIEPMLNK